MKLLVLSLGTVLAAMPLAASAQDMKMAAAPAATAAATPAQVSALKKALESLWVGHVDALRKVAVATIGGHTAAANAAQNEVVANAHAIANAVAGFYGKPAGEKLFTLLAGHWGAIKAYLDATVAKNTAGQSAATSQLTSNADEIATFLSGANPYLPKTTLSEMLLTHGSQHISQIQQLAAHDTAGEAKTAAAMRTHIIALADALADAIAKQFPTKV
jgi:hypothetical protein